MSFVQLGNRGVLAEHIDVMSMLRSRRALIWITLDGAAISLLLAIAGFVLISSPIVSVLALTAAIILFSTFLYLSRSTEEAPVALAAPVAVEGGLPVHPITGLYRWWVFRDRVMEEIARAERQQRGLALVLLEPGDLFNKPPVNQIPATPPATTTDGPPRAVCFYLRDGVRAKSRYPYTLPPTMLIMNSTRSPSESDVWRVACSSLIRTTIAASSSPKKPSLWMMSDGNMPSRNSTSYRSWPDRERSASRLYIRT